MKDANEFVTKDFFSSELEKFAAMVKRGFDHMTERFNTVDARHEAFKKSTEQSFYELKTDMSDVKGRLTNVENRLDSIEDILRPTVNQVNDHEERISDLEMGTA